MATMQFDDQGNLLVAGVAALNSEDRTATADGTGTGQISVNIDHVAVTSANADHILTLPEPVLGKRLILRNGATGYELRSSDPETIGINGGVGAGAESAIGANVCVNCLCDTLTSWLCENISTAGVRSATQVAAA